jgi:tetratricopeptide repeat protein 30
VSLQAAIKYEQDELAGCAALLDQCLADDPETAINYAAIACEESAFAKGDPCLKEASFGRP